jgi:hypothetical protein
MINALVIFLAMMPVPILATDDAPVAESVLLADSACWSTGSFDATELRAQKLLRPNDGSRGVACGAVRASLARCSTSCDAEHWSHFNSK